MEIEITNGADGKYDVRTNTGLLMTVPTKPEATALAIGIRAGFAAAITKLGTAEITDHAR